MLHPSPGVKSEWGRLKVVGPPVGATVWVPLSQTISTVPVTVTGSLNVTPTGALAGTFMAPLVGVVLTTVGGKSVVLGVPVIEMSSIPTHSSLPVALVVMTRNWTCD